MRQIELLEGVRIRFPKRGEEFDVGMETGVIAALMAQGTPSITRQVSHACVEQLQAVVRAFGYNLMFTDAGEAVQVTLVHKSQRPALKLVQ